MPNLIEVLSKAGGEFTVPAGQMVVIFSNNTVGFARIFGYVIVTSGGGGPFGNILIEQGMDDATITDIVTTIAIATGAAVPFSRKVRGKATRMRVQNTTLADFTIRASGSLGVYPETEVP
jgi:hypothetical protein